SNSYSVVAADMNGDGALDLAVANYGSNSVSILKNLGNRPDPPQNLGMFVGDSRLTIAWDRNTESDFLRYRIYGGTLPHPTTQIDSTNGGIGDTVKVIAPLTNGVTYYFRVTAVNTAGKESGFSNEVSAIPWDYVPPAPPRNLTAIPGNGQVVLTWNKNSEPDFLRYLIYGGTSPGPSERIDSTTGGIADTTKVITGLVNGTTYYFHVIAVDVCRNESGKSNEVSVTLTIVVMIDVKPGSTPNSINLKSNGVTPVAILTTSIFDAKGVDPLTVRFGPKGAKESHGKGHIEDANGDGIPDMVLHFKTQETGIESGQTVVMLTGKTLTGRDIIGKDSIVTVGGSLHKSTAEGVIEDDVDIPTSYSLGQNYPNPFNPTTTIRFALPKASHVTLKVYDLLGREMAAIVSQELGPGYFMVRWLADVPSGMYIYRLQAGEFAETKKMILLH
ncbi:MAG: uncharacterized protein HW389_3539, partial [Bacteroidetes bacterium]|nr:uncharacterized protein [Bacteroidota bacterium]